MGAALSLFLAGGGAMAVQISMKLDDRQLRRELRTNGEKWAKQMEYAVKDMRRKGPSIIAGIAVERYNIKRGKLLPGKKTFAGRCSITGGVADMTFIYTGHRLTATHFNMSPGEWPGSPGSFPRAYQIKATILRGNRVKIGHWKRPGSEGGAYSAKSPYMLLPGKKPPLQRTGGGWGGRGGDYQPFRTISVPQMVNYSGNRIRVQTKLQEAASDILTKRLRGLGLS